jgi:phosphoribosylaminoimidazole (AIR) synthetase
MLMTFNCVIGMVLVIARDDVARVRQHLGEESMAIGEVVKRGGGDAARFKAAHAWGAR